MIAGVCGGLGHRRTHRPRERRIRGQIGRLLLAVRTHEIRRYRR